VLDPFREGVQELADGLLGIDGRGAAAEAVVLARDHVEAGERLAGGETAGVVHDGFVVADGAERGDLLVGPPLVDDELPAGLPEGGQVRVGGVVDAGERQQLAVVRQGEAEIVEAERGRGLCQ
jgi:hypothetical protein